MLLARATTTSIRCAHVKTERGTVRAGCIEIAREGRRSASEMGFSRTFSLGELLDLTFVLIYFK